MSKAALFGWCSICGKDPIDPTTHRCPQRTLSAIDAANTRAQNAEASETDKPWHPGEAKDQTLAGRLRVGFRWIAGEA